MYVRTYRRTFPRQYRRSGDQAYQASINYTAARRATGPNVPRCPRTLQSTTPGARRVCWTRRYTPLPLLVAVDQYFDIPCTTC